MTCDATAATWCILPMTTTAPLRKQRAELQRKRVLHRRQLERAATGRQLRAARETKCNATRRDVSVVAVGGAAGCIQLTRQARKAKPQLSPMAISNAFSPHNFPRHDNSHIPTMMYNDFPGTMTSRYNDFPGAIKQRAEAALTCRGGNLVPRQQQPTCWNNGGATIAESFRLGIFEAGGKVAVEARELPCAEYCGCGGDATVVGEGVAWGGG